MANDSFMMGKKKHYAKPRKKKKYTGGYDNSRDSFKAGSRKWYAPKKKYKRKPKKRKRSYSSGRKGSGRSVVHSPYTAQRHTKKTNPKPKKKAAPKKPLPQKVRSRASENLLEHYNLHSLLASDVSSNSIDALWTDQSGFGMGRGRGLGEENLSTAFLESDLLPWFNLGLSQAELQSLLKFEPRYDGSGNLYYRVTIDLPNGGGFRRIMIRMAEDA
jgi:hypothetical protein